MDGNGDDGFEPDGIAAKEAMKGATIKLEDLRREDGILAKAAADSVGKAHVGVLKQAITVELEESKRRQILYLANFVDRDQARKAVAAIGERLMCGVDIDPVLDDIAAMCGVNSERLHMALDAMSHTTFTTNYQKGKKDDHKKSGIRGLLS